MSTLQSSILLPKTHTTGTWDGRFSGKAARIAVQKRHTQERKLAARRRRKGQAVDETVEEMEVRHASELEAARLREHEQMRWRNRCFTDAKKQVLNLHPRLTTAERPQGGFCRLHRREHRLDPSSNPGDPSSDNRLTILCLGDAIFSSTMRGHAPSGHVSVMAALSRMPGVIVMLVDEYRTSKLCFRCAGEMKRVGPAGSREFRCTTCTSTSPGPGSESSSSAVQAPAVAMPTINRDLNGAANILLMGARELIWGSRPAPWQRSSGPVSPSPAASTSS